MARLAAILTLLLLAGGPLFAQAERPESKGDEKPERRERELPRFRGGGPGGWTEGTMKFLTEELDLDATQQEEISKVLNDSIGDIMKRMGQFWGRMEDESARDEMRKAFEDVRLEIAGKISEKLTPAQKREFEVLVDQFDRRANQFEQSRREDDQPSQLFNPKPISKRLLLGKAERSLFLGPEETAVIMPFVERVIDARQALYEGRKVRRSDLTNAISGGADKKEVEQRLADIRAAEQFQQLELLAAVQALRELLTLDQEARFVAMGILE